MNTEMKTKTQKNKSLAKWSLGLGLLFWMPLFNLLFSPLAIFLGIKALIKIKKEPNNYEGKWQAITGIIFGSILFIMILVGALMCLSEIFFKLGFEQVCSDLGLGTFVK